MKLKNIIVALLCVLFMFSLTLTACDKTEKHVCESQCPLCYGCTDLECTDDACRVKCLGHTSTGEDHTHTYSKEWAWDSTDHWHPADCGHDLKQGVEPHTLDENGYCSVCEHQIFSKSGSWTIYSATGSADDSITMPAAPASYPAGSIVLHYRRIKSTDYPHWGFWLWKVGAEGTRYKLQYQDDFGGITVVAASELGGENAKIGIIPIDDDITSSGSWYMKDSAGVDRLLIPEDYKQSDGCYHIYMIEGDSKTYKTAQESNYQTLNFGVTASFKDRTNIDISFATPVTNVQILENDVLLGEWSDGGNAAGRVGFEMDHDAIISGRYSVKATFVKDTKLVESGVDIRVFYDLAEFANAYYYEGNDLGATLGENSTTFKVWSPVSQKIVLNLYNEGDGGTAFETHPMELGDYGVWEYTANTRLAGKYYTYTVYNAKSTGGTEVIDPYAKSAGLNGLRGMIVNFAAKELTPDGWDEVEVNPYSENELVVWETHVADVTSSPTWGGTASKAKTYLGMIESGTTYESNGTTVSTGFDHIVELGVNAVQLVPIFDQANEEDEQYRSFNWGYNPLNYNVLEGSYSSDPTNGYTRIKEFRQLVQAFNEKGINIIMDVVYNHVNDASSSNFEVLMPGYYFRHNATGALSNGSGCGNDTMSERPMFQKFMIDSVTFWAETYKLGGFRFDIMGLHDIETMNKLTQAVRQVNENIVLYGEAWGSNSAATNSSVPLACQSNASLFADRLGQFNDQMRDQVLKFASGSTNDIHDDRILQGFKGQTTAYTNDLFKTLNYVTCHDGFTLYDDFQFNTSIRTTGSQAHRKECSMLANSMILTSNGISFVLAGEELLRSKVDLGAVGDQQHNSYNAPYEVNALDYSRKILYKDVFENYKKLIAFKERFVKDFGLTSNEAVASKYSVQHSGNVYIITINTGSNGTYVIAHAGPQGGTASALSGCTYDFSTTRTSGINSTLEPYETVVGHK